MNPRSPLQVLAVNPRSSDHRKKSIILIESMRFSTRVSREGWPRADIVGGIKLELVFVPGKAKLDSAAYVTIIMEPHLLSLWHRCCEEYGWTVVVEDGVPGHEGYSKKYRELNGMDVIPWPAQSPDLNLIEALLGDMRVELGQIWGRVSDPGAAVEAVWDSIIDERLEELIRSMPDRLQAVIDADGHLAQY